MSRLNHEPGMHAQRAVDKALWLRNRRHVDPEVAETIDVLAEVIVRLDAHIRAIEGRVDKKLSAFGSKLATNGKEES